ncbi:hypothetical protein GCM10022419_065010 [Nonomuraea rosea]|uniref:DUF4386 domain-containing protein n=1 Tax=Nonomuraea rosea TaxID=638574 RepID=A0ABP6XZL4_9ACTN
MFVFQMVSAIFGNALTQEFIAGASGKTALTAGVALSISSGLAVVGIGLLSYQVLKGFNRKLARWYPIMRIAECTVVTACALYLLIQLQAVPNTMLWVYIPTGIGGLVFTYLLFVSRIVPRSIALLGFAGYVLLLLGVPLELLGVLDTDTMPGMLMLAPGGLFEVLVLPVWLFVKGFTLPQPARVRTA